MKKTIIRTVGKYRLYDSLQSSDSYIAVDTSTGIKVKLRMHNKGRVEHKSNIRVINNFKDIRHKNIIPLLDIIEDYGNLWYVREYNEGISLKDYVAKKGKLDEEETRCILYQLIKAYEELYKRGLIYSPETENDIFIEESNPPLVKLTDLEIHCYCYRPSRTPGKIFYNKADPTAINTQFIGKMVYYMLLGTSSDLEIMQDSTLNKYPIREDISDACNNFISRSLQYDGKECISFKEMKEHPFITEQRVIEDIKFVEDELRVDTKKAVKFIEGKVKCNE